MAHTLKLPQAHAPKRKGRTGLIMTDLGVMFVLLLAVFFAVDPFVLYIDKRTIFKHIHLMLAIPIFLMAWMGVRIDDRRRVFLPVTAICWPLMVLAVWIVTGALYARFHDKLIETFLIMGMYMLVTAGAARFVADHHNPSKLLDVYLMLLLVALATGAVWQAAELRAWSKFHELEALTVPLGVFFFARAQSRAGRVLALFFMVLLMLLVIKFTSFIVAALTFAYVWWVFVRPRLARTHATGRLFHYFSLLSAALLAGSTYMAIKLLNAKALPDGNPKYRLFTYERTWEEFTHSPIWGKLFSGAGAEQFGLFQVGSSTQILPSHSDLLDILGQGGIIGMALFLFGLWRIASYIYRNFRARSPQSLGPNLEAHFHWIAVSCLAFLPVVAFNPIMLQPGKAFLIWLNLGILLGLAMRCANTPAVGLGSKS